MNRNPMIARFLLLLLAACSVFSESHAQEQRPNIILLFIDDLGYADTGPFGCRDIPTPRIDRFADANGAASSILQDSKTAIK